MLDRVIDVSVQQNVLTWDASSLADRSTEGSWASQVKQHPFVMIACNDERCGLLADS